VKAEKKSDFKEAPEMDKQQKQQMLEIVPAIITNIPKMGFSLSAAYLRFRGQANRAVREFRQGLCEGGLSPEEAKRLAEDFADGTRFLSFSMLKNMGQLGAREKR
jgi:hypothetical protein